MSEKETIPENHPAKILTAKQKRFCEEYLVDFNATQAAIRAGYSKDTAYSIGWENLRKPEIKAYITQRVAETALSAEEATKMMSDIAKGSLNDYFKVKQVEHFPKIKVGLKHLIQQLNADIIFEDEFASLAKLTKEEKTAHLAERAKRKRQIIRYQIEIKKNPKAYRIIDGPPELVDTVELDMVKLVKDKEKGRIKTLAHTAHGLKVELFSADAALVNVLKMHGSFEKDNDQQKPNVKQYFMIGDKKIEF